MQDFRANDRKNVSNVRAMADGLAMQLRKAPLLLRLPLINRGNTANFPDGDGEAAALSKQDISLERRGRIVMARSDRPERSQP
jgi:hypothetical protein